MTTSWFRAYRRSSLSTRLGIAFVLGAAAGLAAGPPIAVLWPLGDLFIRLLQMLVLPLVVSTIVVGVSAVSPRTLSRVGARTVLWYLLTTLGATVIGVAVATAIRPGDGLRLAATAPGAPRTVSPSWQTLVTGLVPDNVVGAMAQGQLLPVIFFSTLFALALSAARHSGDARPADAARAFFDTVARGTYTILRWVMEYAPVGTFVLVAIVFSQGDAGVATHFAKTIAAVYLSQVLVCAGCVLPLLVSRINPAGFGRAVKEALITAFVTGSSAATLPVELETAERRLRIERSLFAFTLPLGVSIHKVGTAAHLGVVSMFAAYMGGLEVSPTRLALITAVAFLAAVGTPPISGGAFLMLGFVFTQAGLPLGAIGVVVGIPFLGKLNTPINSLGRLVVTAVVARSEEVRALDPTTFVEGNQRDDQLVRA